MKKYILSFFLGLFAFTFTTVNVIAQETTNFNYKISYLLKYHPDSSNPTHVSKERMVLYIGDDYSKFSSWGSHVADSLSRYERENLTFNEFMSLLPSTKFSYTIYKNVPADKVSFTQKVSTTKLYYSEPTTIFDWRLGSASKKIAGYLCKNAYLTYAGRKYEAWFTAEIPISDGPYKFTGLPGLIVQLSDLDAEYEFTLEGFEKLRVPFLYALDLNKYVETTKKAFISAEEKFKKNPLLAMEQSGIQIDFYTEEQKNKMKKDYERTQNARNNPLELVDVNE